MKFDEALKHMKAGALVKRPAWGGYWQWDPEKKTIMLHCREEDSDTGKSVMDIRETQRVEYTLLHILADDWEFANGENCTLLGGVPTFGFDDAIRYLKRGLKVARMGWNGKGMFLCLATDIEFTTPADLSECAALEGELVTSSVVMKTADDKFVVGWLASQTDMLAEDWTLV